MGKIQKIFDDPNEIKIQCRPTKAFIKNKNK